MAVTHQRDAAAADHRALDLDAIRVRAGSEQPPRCHAQPKPTTSQHVLHQ
jgi:hypothetical protein